MYIHMYVECQKHEHVFWFLFEVNVRYCVLLRPLPKARLTAPLLIASATRTEEDRC